MKNLKYWAVLMTIGLFFNACLDDEPTTQVTYQYVPIDSISFKEINPVKSVTEIKTYFTKSNDCELFFDYDYQISGNERTVSIITSLLRNENCIDAPQAAVNTLQFVPTSSGTYTFRFWAGIDENQQAQFIIKEIEIP